MAFWFSRECVPWVPHFSLSLSPHNSTTAGGITTSAAPPHCCSAYHPVPLSAAAGMMEPASHSCFRVNSRFAPLCFIPTTHRARPRPNEPWRLSRRKHRLGCSAAGARTAAEGDHDAHGGVGVGNDGGGIGGGHEQAAARPPAPVQGWTARKGNESLNIKEINVSAHVGRRYQTVGTDNACTAAEATQLSASTSMFFSQQCKIAKAPP